MPCIALIAFFLIHKNTLKKGATLTVERTRLACFSCHSVRSCLTFETAGTSDNSVSSANGWEPKLS